MSNMSIGELTGYVGLNVDDLEKNAKRGQRGIDELAAEVLDAAKAIEKEKFEAKLDADASELEDKLDTAKAHLDELDRSRATPTIDVSSRGYEAVKAIEQELDYLRQQDVTVEVAADVAAAEARLEDARRSADSLDATRVTVDVDADVAAAQRAIAQLEAELASVNRQRVQIRVDVDKDRIGGAKNEALQLASAGMRAASSVMAIGAAVPAIGALGVALTAAAAAAAVLPAILGAAGAGIGALIVGFSGIGDAIGAMNKADSAGGAGAGGAGAARAAAMKQVESAQRSLADAQEQAARTAITSAYSIKDAEDSVADAMRRAAQVAVDGAQQIAAAKAAVADAVAAAADRQEAAEANVARAQDSATSAQEALNRARETAKERIEDLTLALSGAALGEEAANLRLIKAQDALKRAGTNKNSLGYKEAALAVKQAEQAVLEAKDRYGDLKVESEKAAKSGVEGSDEVVAAQKRVSDANAQVLAAQKAAAKAQADGVKSVIAAQERLGQVTASVAQAQADADRDVAKSKESLRRTVEQAGWSQADAANRVADAERALKDAIDASKQSTGGAAGAADKYAQALAKLSPAGRELVKTLEALKPAWHALELDVQEKLLTGVAAEIRDLAGTYLPLLQTMLGGIATAFNQAFKDTSAFLQTDKTINELTVAFGNIEQAVGLFAESLTPIVQIFTDLFTVGSEFLPGMAQGWLDAATSAAAFVTSAKESGKLKEWIQAGLDVLSQLWQILVNVGGIIGAVFGAGSDSGQTFLQTLVDLTGQLRAFLESAAVQGALSTLFNILAAIGPVLIPVAASLWAASVALSAFNGIVKGVRLVVMIAQFIWWAGTVLVWGAIAVASMVATAARYVAQWVMMAVQGAIQVGILIGQMAAWAAGIVVQGAIALGSMIATAASYIVQWVIMAAGAMASAIVMAAAWFVALGPVGWVIALVVGLVALIIANWDTVVAWTTAAWSAVSAALGAAWEWIKGAVSAALDFLVGLFLNFTGPGLIIKHWDTIKAAIGAAWEWIKGVVAQGVQWVLDRIAWFAELGGRVGAWFMSVKDAAVAKLTELLAWVTGLPGRILSALGSLGTLLWNAGMDIISGLWSGIQSMGSWLATNVGNFIRRYVPGPVLEFLGIHSPSRLFRDEIGKWIPAGLAEGINANAGVAATAAREMAAGTIADAKAMVTAADFAEIEAYANTAAAAAGMPGGGLATGQIPGQQPGQSTGATIIVNNPQAEQASDSLNRKARTLEKLGVI